MKNVLINSLFGILALFTSCQNPKSMHIKAGTETPLIHALANTLTNLNPEVNITELQKDTTKILHVKHIKGLRSKNSYDILYNNSGVIKGFNLYYNTLEIIKTSHHLHDSLGFSYNEYLLPIKIHVDYQNRNFQKTLLIQRRGTSFEFDLFEKSPDTLVFNATGITGLVEGEYVLLVKRNEIYHVTDAHHISYKNQIVYKRKIINNDSITDLTKYKNMPPKRIMRTNDFDISLNEKKETVFDVTFKTYGTIDGIPFRHKDFYREILQERPALDLDSLRINPLTLKVNVMNKKENSKYAFKIFPVDDSIFPQEYALTHNNNQTTSFVMRHMYPFYPPVIYSDSIIFYENTNRIKAIYRSQGGSSLKLKANYNNSFYEICEYFGFSYPIDSCIDQKD